MADVAIASCELPDPPAIIIGVNDQPACVDVSPPRENATLPAKPLSDETVTVYAAVLPAVVVTEDGAAERPKSAGAVTTSETPTVWVNAPELPVIVSG